MKTAIIYRDATGQVTRRMISNVIVDNGGNNNASNDEDNDDSNVMIDAYCHAQAARRSFYLRRILVAYNSDTGEVIEDVWKHFDCHIDAAGKRRPESVLGLALCAVYALKFNALLTRGFGQRVRKKVIGFMRSCGDFDDHTDVSLDQWLYTLHISSVFHYEKTGQSEEYAHWLAHIPSAVREPAKAVALAICIGSGRGEVDVDAVERIKRDFQR